MADTPNEADAAPKPEVETERAKPEEGEGKAGEESPGDYTVKETLGRGPFSRVEVWVGKGSGPTVVAKTITREVDAEGFKKAAEGLLKLDHPSVLKTLGFVPATPSQLPALLTALAGRGTLADLMEVPDLLNSTQRAIILVGLAQSLKYLHGKGLVHGNVKPSNIAIDKLGHPQLVTHAQLFASGRKSELDTAWSAPECLSEGELTAAADIYGLGLVAFELITGKPVFDPGLKTWPLLQAIMSGSKPALPGELPAGIGGLIERAWNGEAKVRPTAEEFFEVLSREGFKIKGDVDVLAVRKYASKFVEGAQPGEGEEEAERRMNSQTRDEVAGLKEEIEELKKVLAATQKANAELASALDASVPLLAKEVEVLGRQVSKLMSGDSSK
jgi:hypothetical protein